MKRIRSRPNAPTNAVDSAGRSPFSRNPFRKDGIRKGDHQRAGAEYIVSADMSCLMHQGRPRRGSLPIKFIHIAQILNGARA